jgi:hypothetical protein
MIVLLKPNGRTSLFYIFLPGISFFSNLSWSILSTWCLFLCYSDHFQYASTSFQNVICTCTDSSYSDACVLLFNLHILVIPDCYFLSKFSNPLLTVWKNFHYVFQMFVPSRTLTRLILSLLTLHSMSCNFYIITLFIVSCSFQVDFLISYSSSEICPVSFLVFNSYIKFFVVAYIVFGF